MSDRLPFELTLHLAHSLGHQWSFELEPFGCRGYMVFLYNYREKF
jgi:hypothetical protein